MLGVSVQDMDEILPLLASETPQRVRVFQRSLPLRRREQGLFSKPVLGFGKVFVVNKVPVLIEANSKPKAPQSFEKRFLIGPRLAHLLYKPFLPLGV